MNTFDFTEINNLINKCKNYLEEGQVKIVNINDCQLIVFENGNIYRNYRNCGDWRLIPNNANSDHGYNIVNCNGAKFRRHRIIGSAFLNLDISNLKLQIDHIDGNRLNNNMHNLRVVSNQQNSYNNHISKGYSWNKVMKQYQALIQFNKTRVILGYFKTEEEAQAAYKAAKLIYHVIN
jgi:hypothetical protein